MNDRVSYLGAAAVADITPPSGLRMGGYAARGDARATGAHDPLEAVLVWLRSTAPAHEVVWVVLDALAVDVELATALRRGVAREVGCDAGAVQVSATHTHSGPAGWFRDPFGRTGPDGGEASRDELVRRIAAAARTLPPGLEPVTIGFAEGAVNGLGSNRDDPGGLSDPSLGVLALRGGDGRLRAALLDHGCHPTVLGHANTQWSADWPGAARAELRRMLPGNPVVGILQGASGDVSTRFTRRAQTFAEAERLGTVAARTAAELLEHLEPPTGSIASARSNVSVPLRARPNAAAAAAGVASAYAAWRRVLSDLGPSPEERIARTRHEGAQMTLEMARRGLPQHVEMPIAAAAVGDVAYVELPVELFSAPALAIRHTSPFRHTRVVGLAGGCFGYVADAAAHEAAVYEALASPFDAAAADIVVDAAGSLLRQLHSSIRKEELWPTATH